MSNDLEAALSIARKRRDDGGGTSVTTKTAPAVPHFFSGSIHSHVSGRTDHLPLVVESGSYVIPADCVSAGGEGNTMAGFKILRRVFGGEPYGASKHPYGVSTGPYGSPAARAAGGRVKASGILFLTPDKEILLLRRAGKSHHGEWGLPAGRIEKGETPQEAARRETREEAGYDHEGGLAPFMHSTDEGVDFTTFIAHSDKFPAKINDEHDQAMWVKPEKALSDLPLHPGVRSALRKLGERSRKAQGGASSGVPIVAAGGEHVLSPSQVRAVGHGDIDMGHRVLDAFVLKVRKELIHTLKNLAPPKKD